MSDSEQKIDVKHPLIRKLLEILPHQPELLAERRRKIEAKREFQRRVWERALLDAGFIGNERIAPFRRGIKP